MKAIGGHFAVLCWIPFVCFATSCFGQSSDVNLESLIRLLETADREYRQSLSGVSGVMEFQAGEVKNSTRFDIFGDNVRTLAGPPNCAEDDYLLVHGYNSEYNFVLNRPAGGAWRAVDINRLAKTREGLELDKVLKNPPLLLSQCITNVPLLDLVKESSFRLNSAKRAGDEVRMDFAAGNLKCRPHFEWISGVVVLDVGHGAFVRSAKLRHMGRGVEIEENIEATYGQVRSIPVVRSLRSHSTFTNGESMIVSYDLSYLPTSAALKDFTLSSFGLPEPPGTSVLQRGVPVWMVGTIGGALFIALGFYLKRRHAKNS